MKYFWLIVDIMAFFCTPFYMFSVFNSNLDIWSKILCEVLLASLMLDCFLEGITDY